MKIKEHLLNDIKVAEIISGELIIRTTGNALDLIGSLYYQGFDKMILHKQNISPDFFDLKIKL